MNYMVMISLVLNDTFSLILKSLLGDDHAGCLCYGMSRLSMITSALF
jgi:hypothetical protein